MPRNLVVCNPMETTYRQFTIQLLLSLTVSRFCVRGVWKQFFCLRIWWLGINNKQNRSDIFAGNYWLALRILCLASLVLTSINTTFVQTQLRHTYQVSRTVYYIEWMRSHIWFLKHRIVTLQGRVLQTTDAFPSLIWHLPVWSCTQMIPFLQQ